MTKQSIPLNNDHQISYQTYGTGDNTIIFFHGLLGSSRISREWEAAIAQADVRLIALERSGHGDSSQFEMESVAGWMPVMQEIAGKLGIVRADVVGVSAGAPYAYASACALPDIIRKVGILAGVPAVYEDSILQHYTPENRLLYRSCKENTIPDIQEYYIGHMRQSLEYCKESDGECGEHVIRALEESLEQNCYGMALESKLQIFPWGLPLRDIRQPVVMYHAKDDEMIPFAAAREMPRHLPNCTFREIPTTGSNVHIRSSTDAFLDLLGEYR
jgi:pimeloyl-ACP methyl ester carboxylesterase